LSSVYEDDGGWFVVGGVVGCGVTWRCHVVVVVGVCSGGLGRRMVVAEGGVCRSWWWVVVVEKENVVC
jgi:hypothetical protein